MVRESRASVTLTLTRPPAPKSKKNVAKEGSGANTSNKGTKKSSKKSITALIRKSSRGGKPAERYEAPSIKPLKSRKRKSRQMKKIPEIEKVLKKRTKSGKVQYLLKWKGFLKSEATWESVTRKNYKIIKEFNEDEEEEDWEVDKIVDKRTSLGGKTEYLLKWKHYPESRATWTFPEENYRFKNLIREYEERLEEEQEWGVDRILGKRMRGGKPEYLLKWTGYAVGDSTWECADGQNFNELIKEFEERKAEAALSTSKEASNKISTVVHENLEITAKGSTSKASNPQPDQEDSKKTQPRELLKRRVRNLNVPKL